MSAAVVFPLGGGESRSRTPFQRSPMDGKPLLTTALSQSSGHPTPAARARPAVTLHDVSCPLTVGDTVAYEFVSAERRWQWALGTVESVHGHMEAPGKTVTQTARKGISVSSRGSSNGAVDTDVYLLVTVRDWVLSKRSGGSSGSAGAVTALSNGERLQQLESAKDAAAREVIQAQTLVEIAWDSITDSEYYHWENLMRCPSHAVPYVTRLTLLGFLTYLGLITCKPSEDDPIVDWTTMVSVMQSNDFSHHLHDFFFENVVHKGDDRAVSQESLSDTSRRQGGPATLPLPVKTGGLVIPPMTGEQRAIHAYVKWHIIDNPYFRYDHAVCTDTLTGRLFKWVQSVAHYFDSLAAMEAAGRGALPRHPVAPTPTVAAGSYWEVFSFVKSTTRTTTVRSSVLCKVVSSSYAREELVLSQADIEAISAIACAQRSPRCPPAPDAGGDAAQQSQVAHLAVVEAQMQALLARESAGREAVAREAAEYFAELRRPHICHMDCCLANTISFLKNNQVDTVAKGEFANPTALLLHRHQQAVVYAEDSRFVNVYFLTRVHEYAEMLEKTRYQLRKREAAHLKAVDALQTALIHLLEHHGPPDSQLRYLVTAAEDAVDGLMEDSCETTSPVTRRLPVALRTSLRERFPITVGPGAALSKAMVPTTRVVKEVELCTAATDEKLALAVYESTMSDARGTKTAKAAASCGAADPAVPPTEANGHEAEIMASESSREVSLTTQEEAAPEFSRLSPLTSGDVKTPWKASAQRTWDGEPHCRRDSGGRSEELVRQEQEIVRLTELLEIAQEERGRLQRRLSALQLDSSPPSQLSVECAARDDAAGEASADGGSRRHSATSVCSDTLVDITQRIRAIHRRLRSRAQNAVSSTKSAVATLSHQMKELLDTASPGNPSAWEKALTEKRLDVLRSEQSFFKAELALHQEDVDELRALQNATAKLVAGARFHDERWELYENLSIGSAASGGNACDVVTTSHIKILSGFLWESCVRVHRCRAREAAIHDIASATHIPNSAILLNRMEASEGGLYLSFDVRHNASVKEKTIEYRLRQFPFRSLMDLYENHQDPAGGSDALQAELDQLRRQLRDRGISLCP